MKLIRIYTLYTAVTLLFLGNSLSLFSTPNDIHSLDNLKKQIEKLPDVAKFKILNDSIQKSNDYLRNELMSQLYLEIAKSKSDSSNIAEGYYKLATAYRLKGEYSYSLENFENALNIFLSIKDTLRAVRTYINLGMVYINTEDIDIAYNYYLKALSFSEAIKDMNSIGISSHRLCNYFCIKKDYKKAMLYAEKAINSYLHLEPNVVPPKETGLSITFRYIGNIYHEQQQYDSAMVNYLKAIEYGKIVKRTVLVSEPLTDLGRLYNDKKDYRTAMKYLLQCDSIINLTQRNRLKATILKELSISYEGLNDFKTSLEYYKLYKIECDTLNKYNIKEIKAKLELQKANFQNAKDLENESFKRKIVIVVSISILLIFVILIILLLSKYKLNKKLNSYLENLNQTKTRLFSMISHDLKSPIDALQQEAIINIKNDNMTFSITKMKFLIDNLLNWSRIQLDGVKLYFEVINLHSFIGNNFEICNALAKNKNISLINDTDKNLTFNADVQALGIVIRNLLVNAIKYSHKDSNIVVYSAVESNYICIFIKDYGVGLDIETKNSLFDKNNTNSKKGTNLELGNGIGLIIVKEILVQHFARLEVFDNIEGGTIFKILIEK